MTILIIEDEELTARKLQRLLMEVEPMATVVGMTVSVEDSIEWMLTNPKPDLIFMDIELADGQSFDIFNQVSVTSPVIFTTAYDEYAIKAFKVNSIDYLLKPVKEDDLRQALAKLRALRQVLLGHEPSGETGNSAFSLAHLLAHLRGSLEVPQTALSPTRVPLPATFRDHPVRDRFMIKQGQRLFSVSIEDIAYFFTRHKMSFLKTRTNDEWMLDYNLDELNQMLDPRRFFRLNRQVITELRAVDKVHLYFNGKLKISLLPVFEEEVIVSREKAGDFKGWLGE